jgi:hypothetical protein
VDRTQTPLDLTQGLKKIVIDRLALTVKCIANKIKWYFHKVKATEKGHLAKEELLQVIILKEVIKLLLQTLKFQITSGLHLTTKDHTRLQTTLLDQVSLASLSQRSIKSSSTQHKTKVRWLSILTIVGLALFSRQPEPVSKTNRSPHTKDLSNNSSNNADESTFGNINILRSSSIL